MREACHINCSLSALGNVVAALERRDTARGTQKPHVPYRDSKLTRLLQDSLGGNAYTTVLCCLGAAHADRAKVLSTLRFASRCKHVKQQPKLNMDPRDAEIKRLNKLVLDLRAQLAHERSCKARD